MIVIITVQAEYEVDVDHHDEAAAVQAAVENWDTVYKQRARWRHGIAPQLVGKVIAARTDGR